MLFYCGRVANYTHNHQHKFTIKLNGKHIRLKTHINYSRYMRVANENNKHKHCVHCRLLGGNRLGNDCQAQQHNHIVTHVCQIIYIGTCVYNNNSTIFTLRHTQVSRNLVQFKLKIIIINNMFVCSYQTVYRRRM